MLVTRIIELLRGYPPIKLLISGSVDVRSPAHNVREAYSVATTARHNSVPMAKIIVFLERQTTDVTMNINGVGGDDADFLQ